MNRRPTPGKRRRRGPGAGNATGPNAPVVNGNALPVSSGEGPPPPAPNHLKAIAYRGYRALYPENTLRAVKEALQGGARMIAIDVQITLDGVPVLFRDNELERVCGRPGKVFEIASEDFLKLKAAEAWRFGPTRYANEPVATLEQAVQLLKTVPDAFVFVEVMDGSVFKHGVAACYTVLAPLLKALGDRLALISFDTDFLVYARERAEFRLGAVLREWEEREVSAMRFIDPEFLFCDVRGVPDTGRLSFGRAEIGVFELDEARKAIELSRRGVSLIETFAILELSQALARSANQRSERRGPPREPREPREPRDGNLARPPQGPVREPRVPREPREDGETTEATEGNEARGQQPPAIEQPPILTIPQEPDEGV